MNRRNFILGLGTAATLSGAASVTGASITSTTEPGADFRVISDEALNVRRNRDLVVNGEFDESLDGYVNTSTSGGDFTEGEGDLNFSTDSPVYDSGGPNITADDQINGDLNVSLATLNTNDTDVDANRNASLGGNEIYVDGTNQNGGSATGNNPLEVENLGSGDAQVGVSYNYDQEAIDATLEETVNQLFTFVNPNNGEVISPTGTDGTHGSNFLTVAGGDVEEVGFVINYSDEIASTLAEQFSTGFGDASEDNFSLLDTVEFGVNDS